jgi:hypothetical protein
MLRLSVGTTQARAAHVRLQPADSLDRRDLL